VVLRGALELSVQVDQQRRWISSAGGS